MKRTKTALTGAAGAMGAHLGHRAGGVPGAVLGGAVAATLQHKQNKMAMGRPHPPGQNRIGPHNDHPNARNAATGIKSKNPVQKGFKNRVERKKF